MELVIEKGIITEVKEPRILGKCCSCSHKIKRGEAHSTSVKTDGQDALMNFGRSHRVFTCAACALKKPK